MNLTTRKWALGTIAVLILIFGLLTVYLANVDFSVPEGERNGPIDPATYMTSEQLKKAEDYSRIRYVMIFLQLPYEWIIYILILFFGLSGRLQKWLEKAFRWSVVNLFFFLLIFSLAFTLLFLPLDLLSFYIGHSYGLTTQTLSSWVEDQILSFWIDFIFTFIAFAVLFILMKRTKRWWLYAWLLTIPMTLFLYFIQPVILDPLFNEFRPLQEGDLKQEILALALQADIPTDQVYEVNMSTKRSSLNAYVTGIGSTARIVLWDTTLQKLEKDEILFVMAHEMGHYVKKHLYWGILFQVVISFIFFWLMHKMIDPFIRKFGESCGIHNKHDFAIYPYILLLISVLSFVGSPIENWVSRTHEMSADRYALGITQNQDAAVSAFQKLSAEGLTYPNPPGIVRFFVYTHPTLVERIRTAIQFVPDDKFEP